MLCYEIFVNNQKMCTVGVGEFGVLTAILSWVQVRPEERLSPDKEWRTGTPKLRIGGLANEEHFEWLKQHLKLGDEVTIRIIEADAPDEPKRKYRHDPTFQEERRRTYEKLKREFEDD